MIRIPLLQDVIDTNDNNNNNNDNNDCMLLATSIAVLRRDQLHLPVLY